MNCIASSSSSRKPPQIKRINQAGWSICLCWLRNISSGQGNWGVVKKNQLGGVNTERKNWLLAGLFSRQISIQFWSSFPSLVPVVLPGKIPGLIWVPEWQMPRTGTWLGKNQEPGIDSQSKVTAEMSGAERDSSFLSALAGWAPLLVIWFRKKLPSF